MNNFLIGLKHFFYQFFNVMSNLYFWIIAGTAYLLGYPDKKQMLLLATLCFIFDILTRFIAIRRQNGGLYKALLNGKLSSKKFIDGFITKVIGYFIILVIANFSCKIDEIALIGGIISTTLYCGLFLYELISIFENLRDAGFILANGLLHKINVEKNKLLDINKSDNVKDTKSE